MTQTAKVSAVSKDAPQNRGPLEGDPLHEKPATGPLMDPLRPDLDRLWDQVDGTEWEGDVRPLAVHVRNLVGLVIQLRRQVAQLEGGPGRGSLEVPGWLQEHARGERLDAFAEAGVAGLLAWGGPAGSGSVYDVAKIAYDFAAAAVEERDRRFQALRAFRARQGLEGRDVRTMDQAVDLYREGRL